MIAIQQLHDDPCNAVRFTGIVSLHDVRGERQRVAICRALLIQPDLLLADEPTGNLDPVTSEQTLALLMDTVRAQGSTLVMVTHDHSLLKHFAQTIDFSQFLTTADADNEASAD